MGADTGRRKVEVVRFWAGIGACVFSFCTAARPTAEEIDAANYGPKVSREEMTAGVRNLVAPTLFDPYSAVISCEVPIKSWVISSDGTTYFGYTAGCNINAKNRFGGYTGNQAFGFVVYIENGARRGARINKTREFGRVPDKEEVNERARELAKADAYGSVADHIQFLQEKKYKDLAEKEAIIRKVEEICAALDCKLSDSDEWKKIKRP